MRLCRSFHMMFISGSSFFPSSFFVVRCSASSHISFSFSNLAWAETRLVVTQPLGCDQLYCHFVLFNFFLLFRWSLSLCEFFVSLHYFFFGALLLKNNLYVSWKFWIFHFIMYITLLCTPFISFIFLCDWTTAYWKQQQQQRRRQQKQQRQQLRCAKCWKTLDDELVCYWLCPISWCEYIKHSDRERYSMYGVHTHARASHKNFPYESSSSSIPLHFIQIHTPFL